MYFFELYDIPVSFEVNARALKRRFHALSKQYHPDFHTDKSEEEQAEILDMSGKVNEAYQILKDADKRMKYILDQKGLLQEGKDKLPQMFLMEMMDINEALMELEFGADAKQAAVVKSNVDTLENSMLAETSDILESYDDEKVTEQELSSIKNYYLKKRYLLRIRENLNKFASA